MILQGSLPKIIESGKRTIQSASSVVLDLINHVWRSSRLEERTESTVSEPIDNLAVNFDNGKVLSLFSETTPS